jgi:hypothetical protein
MVEEEKDEDTIEVTLTLKQKWSCPYARCEGMWELQSFLTF